MKRIHAGIVGAFSIVAASSSSAADVSSATSHETWPQWRGPTRDAKTPSGPAWPDNLKGLTQRWRVPLGPSYSGPIVAEDRVFTTQTRDAKTEIVHALDRKSGAEIWKAEWPGAMSVPFFAKRNGDWIRSTPAYDGESLYVAGMCDVLVCLSAKDGVERWRLDFDQKYHTGIPGFGFVPSPLVDGDHVYAQAADSLVKLNKRTGDVVWRTLQADAKELTDDGAFSSPILATLAGRRQLIVQTRRQLCGVDPADGNVLWRTDVPAFRGSNILTPTVYSDGVFTSSYQNKSFFFGVSWDGSASHYTVAQKWTSKGQGYMSSPVVISDFCYLPLGNGRLSCIDLRNGNEQWRTKSMGDYWSIAAHGDRFLGLSCDGTLYLVQADPTEFRLLDQRRIADSETWAHVAVAGRELFVRELEALAMYSWE